ncbi:uncharacterized protein LOC128670642 isoform X2 [Plodia interpunctella]|uniref:uncharacterized protein LOC128670642 isoform X2 n=1 Tax=Plodia interpunctella TaxID=58824 RepID=UPI0023685E8C|nr:uncharacterized protein LOC128670642 isoform X2 [Plodia interpunctella]
MDSNKNTLDELLDLTDTEESTSSSSHQVFEGREAFVLELHDLKKDEPTKEQEPDKKKRKKRKNKLSSTASNTESSSSASESSIPPTSADAAKEQFFDAHESYHGLQDPVSALGQAVQTSNRKTIEALRTTAPSAQPPSATSKHADG